RDFLNARKFIISSFPCHRAILFVFIELAMVGIPAKPTCRHALRGAGHLEVLQSRKLRGLPCRNPGCAKAYSASKGLSLTFGPVSCASTKAEPFACPSSPSKF